MNLDYSPVLDESGEPARRDRHCRRDDGAGLGRSPRGRRAGATAAVASAKCRASSRVLSGPEHVYEYVNDAYVKISGRSDFVGRSVREVFPELAGQGYFELLDQVYSTGERVVTRGMELRLQGSDEVQYVDFVYEPIRDEKGEVTGIFVGGYEVTEAHRAAAALRAVRPAYAN